MDVSSGVDRGRIWRIAPEGYKPRTPKLGKATTAELVALLEHPDGWHRDTVSRLLYQRQDRSAISLLRRLAAGSRHAIGRAHALSSLAGLGALEPADVLAALGDPDGHLRAHALRLAEPFAPSDDRIAGRIIAMTSDPDAMVRYQLAFSLGSLPGGQPAAALSALAVRDGSDPWMRLAILSSVAHCTGGVFTRLAADAGFRATGHGRGLLMALAGQTGAAERPDDLAAILAYVDGPLAGEPELARGVVLFLVDGVSPAARSRLIGALGGRLRATLDGLLADARTAATDDTRPTEARLAAIRALPFAGLADVERPLAELMAPRQPAAVQAAAIEALARFDDPRVPAILLRGWPQMSPKLRATAVEALFSRPAWLNALLEAVEKGTIARADLDPARLDLLRSYPDAAIRARAGRLFGAPQARRKDVVAAYQVALRTKGDPRRGKEVFKANCSTCHRLEGVGQQVGAELSAIRDRGLDTVLLNILDPNREVMPQFLSYVLVTTSGRVLTGLIASETPNSLTIRQPDGREETVLRIHIDELRGTGLSYMPEGLEKQIDVPAMADLLSYLNSIK
jgi:putative heme-binding domain-containing protein